MGVREALAQKLAEKLAGTIDKQYLLDELKKEWAKHLKPGFDVMGELERSLDRIKKSKQEKLFKAVGITTDDIKRVLEELK